MSDRPISEVAQAIAEVCRERITATAALPPTVHVNVGLRVADIRALCAAVPSGDPSANQASEFAAAILELPDGTPVALSARSVLAICQAIGAA